MRKIRIGIDVGKKGAIVFFIDDVLAIKAVMPTIKTEVDLVALKNLIRSVVREDDDCHVVIEDVHAIYGSSAGATFSFGWAKGILEGCVSALDLPYTLVQPKEWQKLMWQGVPQIKKDGKRTNDTKAMSLLAVTRLFPNEDFRANGRCRIPHDGIVDATLMAEYCRRKF